MVLLAAIAIALALVPAAAAAPRAPVRDCADRITDAWIEVDGKRIPERFEVDPAHDLVVGPIAFSHLLDYQAEWDVLVRDDQWTKSVAILRPRARVTLEVPAEQRGWMRLEYAHTRRGRHAVTLRACRHRRTPFSGGFTIDYARAPDQGRCAELILRIRGEDGPRRERLFPALCP